ncbi:hypothetical protein DLM76_01730 [Leptospira yasudae]|nr:hypothetical protein DLM76_01730 [Leptospira yasudae]
MFESNRIFADPGIMIDRNEACILCDVRLCFGELMADCVFEFLRKNLPFSDVVLRINPFFR